jgi:hypothetical protein
MSTDYTPKPMLERVRDTYLTILHQKTVNSPSKSKSLNIVYTSRGQGEYAIRSIKNDDILIGEVVFRVCE